MDRTTSDAANDGDEPAANEHREPRVATAGSRPQGPRRPKTVLVLGGGGMKGFAHIGVIRALERLGIEVDEVVGTSMGAVMGGLYAQGRDSRSIEAVAGEISVKDYLKLNLLKFLVKGYRHASVYKGKHFHDFLRHHLPETSFEQLELPFVCNALSLTRGAMRYFGMPGDEELAVADAIYASSCLPGVYEPPEIQGDHYIDGGMAETISLKVAHARQADLVIAVDLSIRDATVERPFRHSLPHILFQTYEIMGGALNEHNLHRHVDDRVVLIKPKVGAFGVLDQPDLTELVRIGERETLEVLSTHPLTRYLADPDVLREIDRTVPVPRDFVRLEVDENACIHCGVCAVTCATGGYAGVARGSVVRKLHNYECTRDAACERNCPTGAIRLGNV